jgi:hypothetical protein
MAGGRSDGVRMAGGRSDRGRMAGGRSDGVRMAGGRSERDGGGLEAVPTKSHDSGYLSIHSHNKSFKFQDAPNLLGEYLQGLYLDLGKKNTHQILRIQSHLNTKIRTSTVNL